jgi:hypothetical protein
MTTVFAPPRLPSVPWPLHVLTLVLAAGLLLSGPSPAAAQSGTDWFIGVPGTTETPSPAEPPAGPEAAPAPPDAASGAPPEGGLTVAAGEPTLVRFAARLTADGEQLDQGLVWRVFGRTPENEAKTVLLQTKTDASPTLKLKAGDYIVNAAFGRAHITRRISVAAKDGDPAVEQFILNAGGLRLKALVGGAEAPHNTVSYTVFSDRDQGDNRRVVVSAARPGVIVRLNAGIYHIVSTYGDCNAVVASDVTVEAGKLTVETVTHAAAMATFKLVPRAGGEALPDTQWTIESAEGDEIKESVGALPTHILAPGVYTVIAKSQGKTYQREISLADGDTSQVELVMN